MIYTVGYGAYPNAAFRALVRRHKIDLVIDVRPRNSGPLIYKGSRGSHLSKMMRIQGVSYRHYPEFSERGKGPWFMRGIEEIKAALDRGVTPLLMGYRPDPIHCHRAIIVAREFRNEGFEVWHILRKRRIESHEAFEQRLRAEYSDNLDEAYSLADRA